jgi:hypothetical protein
MERDRERVRDARETTERMKLVLADSARKVAVTERRTATNFVRSARNTTDQQRYLRLTDLARFSYGVAEQFDRHARSLIRRFREETGR